MLLAKCLLIVVVYNKL